MKLSPFVEKWDTGLAISAAIAMRTSGVSRSPVTSGWMSLIQSPSESAMVAPPTGHDSQGGVHRLLDVACGGPSCEGAGAAQAGAGLNVPSGCSDLRSSTALP